MILIYNLIIFTIIALITFHAPWLGFVLLSIGILVALYQTRDFEWEWKRKGLIYYILAGTTYWTLAIFVPWFTIMLSAVLFSIATTVHYRYAYDPPQHHTEQP